MPHVAAHCAVAIGENVAPATGAMAPQRAWEREPRVWSCKPVGPAMIYKPFAQRATTHRNVTRGEQWWSIASSVSMPMSGPWCSLVQCCSRRRRGLCRAHVSLRSSAAGECPCRLDMHGIGGLWGRRLLKAGAGDQSAVRRQLQPHTTPAPSHKTILLPRNFNEWRDQQ
jgi:hypothetical protein